MAIKGTKSTENGYDVYTMGGGSSPSYGGSSSGSGGSSSAGKGQGGNGPNGGFVKKSGSGGSSGNGYGSAAKAYEKALAAQNAQRKSMYDSSLGQINQSADEALRQAYLQKTKAEYAAPQQALAMGATGGMSESTIAAMNAAYGNNRNNIDTARMGGIEQATGAYNEGQAADLAGYNQQLAALALREEDRKYQQAQYERELANQQSQYNRELTDKKAMMEYQKQLDAKYRVATGGSGGSSTKAWKPPMSPSELMKMIDAGYSGDMIDRSLAYYAGEQGMGIQNEPSISKNAQDSWTPQGKTAYIQALKAQGKTSDEIAQLVNNWGF